MILYNGYLFTFLPTFQTISKKGWMETLFFFLITFPRKSLLPQRFFLETVQKVGKIVDIHFFENVAFEKKLPVNETFPNKEFRKATFSMLRASQVGLSSFYVNKNKREFVPRSRDRARLKLELDKN